MALRMRSPAPERSMAMKVTALLVILFLFFAPMTARSQPGMKLLRQTSATSGEEMYLSYCAECHGRDATGIGAKSKTLKVPATNLTLLARENKGVFPAARVKETIRGDVDVVAHGP